MIKMIIKCDKCGHEETYEHWIEPYGISVNEGIYYSFHECPDGGAMGLMKLKEVKEVE